MSDDYKFDLNSGSAPEQNPTQPENPAPQNPAQHENPAPQNPAQHENPAPQNPAQPENPAPQSGNPYYGAPQNPSQPSYYSRNYGGGFGYGQPQPPKPPKKKKSRVALIVTCVVVAYFVLIAALLAGISGGVIHFGAQDQTPAGEEVPQNSEKTDNPPISSSTDSDGKTLIMNDDYTGNALSASQIYNQNVDSIVFIQAKTSMSSSLGTGFVIDETNGYILTNYHVVEGGTEIIVNLYNGESYNATLIGGDSLNDVAVLKIGAQGLKKVTIGDSDKISIGGDIVVIGNPLGELTYTLTKGVVSALNRSVTTSEYSITMFQIDAAANSGNSGGPAFDATGAVVGIVSAKYAATGVEGIGFCIPINDAMRVATDLVNNGYVTGRPNLGVTVSTSSGYTTSVDEYGRRVVTESVKGALVEAVNNGSCAAKAGLQKGDIVTKFGGTAITNSSELINAKNAHKAGETVEMEVFRGGSTVTLTVTLDEYRPQ